MDQLCEVFDGGMYTSNDILTLLISPACSQAKNSRTRPTNPGKQLFTSQEFEWFSKTAYNLALKYCTDISPISLVKLLRSCIEVHVSHSSNMVSSNNP